ncbi:MAG: type I-E CRISPR-associated protein Cse2/CasB [Legionellales bacterium]|jgi:CRISPR type I-E-associated protein CasB/Cse2
MSKFDVGPIIAWLKDLNENNGQRAILRRCKTLPEIYLQPAYVNLCQTLGEQGTRKQLVLIAGILAHIKNPENYDVAEHFCQKMALKKSSSDAPQISRLRFQRLLTVKSDDQRFRLLIRIVPQIEKFNLNSFIEDLFYWGDNKKKQWAFHYYSGESFLKGK